MNIMFENFQSLFEKRKEKNTQSKVDKNYRTKQKIIQKKLNEDFALSIERINKVGSK